jgi:mannose/fructose/N-acetylgalactosamine-specific phosphotransferase system component IIC
VLWVLPPLALWANLHGSVVLGAALATIYGLTLAVRAQTRLRALVLAVGSPLCLLASPYGFRLVAYYHLMLVNPPLKHYVSEWKPPAFVASNAIFFLSAVAVALLWIVRRSTLTTFEQWALPLLALAAFAAGRNTIWFELGAVVAIPRLLNARSQPVLEPASIRRANSVLAAAAIAVALAVCTFQLAHANSRIERNRPSAAAAAVAAAAGSHGIVLADDAHADWLLWLQPSLVGRVAYDVRFELFSARELRQIQLLHDASRPIWRRCGATARVVTFESRKDEQAVRAADGLTDRSRTIVSTPSFVAIVQPVVGQDACKL